MDSIKSLKKFCLCLVLLSISGCSNENADDKKEINTELIVEIRDLTPPIINLKESVIHTDVDKEIDLSKYIKIIDNKDHNLTYQLDGTIDYQQSGEYKIKVLTQDTSGNTASDIITVIVAGAEDEEQAIDQPLDPPQSMIPPTAPQFNQPNQSIDSTPIVVPKPNSNSHSPVPASIDFLFTDGYTYESAYSACVAAGTQALDKGQAAKYTCNPIKTDGKYTGYNLSFE